MVPVAPFLTRQNAVLGDALSPILSHWLTVLLILLITSQMEILVFTADNCFLVCIVLGLSGGCQALPLAFPTHG